MKARNAREKEWFSFGSDLGAASASEPIMRRASGSSSTLGWSRSWCAARRIATRRAVRLNVTSCIAARPRPLPLCSQQRGFAFLTGADLAQEFPRVNAKVVVIVPLEPDGVFAHAFRGDRLG